MLSRTWQMNLQDGSQQSRSLKTGKTPRPTLPFPASGGLDTSFLSQQSSVPALVLPTQANTQCSLTLDGQILNSNYTPTQRHCQARQGEWPATDPSSVAHFLNAEKPLVHPRDSVLQRSPGRDLAMTPQRLLFQRVSFEWVAWSDATCGPARGTGLSPGNWIISRHDDCRWLPSLPADEGGNHESAQDRRRERILTSFVRN